MAPGDFAATLERLGVEPRYHALLQDLTGGQPGYLADVAAEDLSGREDAGGGAVTLPIARGLVRKLAAQPPSGGAEQAPVRTEAWSEPGAPDAAPPAGDGCGVSLLRSAAAPGAPGAGLVRCGLRGALPSCGEGRRKILVIVLDRSGSMAGAMWRRVVEAVAGVLTDELLRSPRVSVAFVAYADEAREVELPGTAAGLRELLLSPAYAPRGGTSFKAAFRCARAAVGRELARHTGAGVAAKDVDIATLLFTDGEDTSVKGRAGRHGVQLVDAAASSAAARAAGDDFREALRRTGCPSYVCIAAFGADHDPDQCQYLADRYYFINRGEVLAEVLAGGLGVLLSSAGQCSVQVRLPPGVSMEEPLPDTLPLDRDGRLDHHVWLRAPLAGAGAVAVDVEVAGASVLRGSAELGLAPAAEAGSFEERLFLADLVALQLRQVARELSGGRGAALSAERLRGLRARLTEAKERLAPLRGLAGDARGALRGRAALRERLREVEGARERLSYALGQFDEEDFNDRRRIGSVAIDAILRDAGQHVPQGGASAALVRRAAAAAVLPPPEPLSSFGREYSTDPYSCCDAFELARQGDALFFQLGGVAALPGGGFATAEEGEGLVSYEAFELLSGGGKRPVKYVGSDDGFTHCGIPLYATPGHFLRVRAVLPATLAPLTASGAYAAGDSERQLLSLLGRAVAAGPRKSEGQALALLQKARAVRAVLAATQCPGGATLLEAVVAESAAFVEDPGARAGAGDLYAVAAAGLLAEDWGEAELERLAGAVVEEALRRRVAGALRGAGEAQRLCLAWALLGPANSEDGWMDEALPAPDAGDLALGGGGFDPFAAPSQLEALERGAPGRALPRAAGAAALLSIASARLRDGAPPPQAWGTLRLHLPAFARAAAAAGGTALLWRCVDAAMADDAPGHRERLQRCVEAVRAAAPAAASLRAAFLDAGALAEAAAAACLPVGRRGESLRLAAAAGLREVVERRRALVVRYPIAGAALPQLETHDGATVAEVWGAQAQPTDPALHHRVALRVWRRTMRARLTATVREALVDREYRRRGGRFAFPSPLDTFVRGLHRRTKDLHEDWRARLRRETSGDAACAEAVAEMLLRLRWDDRDDGARAKLAHLVARIWDGLEGLDLSGRAPLSSALWLHDAGPAPPGAQAPAEVPPLQRPPAKRGAAGGEEAANLCGSRQAADATAEAAEAAEAGGDRRARAARAAMDAGLASALEGVDAEVRGRMERFAADARPGSRLKLPLALTAKQRKAIHLWADTKGVEHKSFGYRGRRRLHLTVPGSAAWPVDEDEEAWASDLDEEA